MKNKLNKKAEAKNPWFYISVVAIIVVVILSYSLLKPSGTGGVIDVDNAGANKQIPPSALNIIEVSEDDDAVKGDVNAPVTIIEFSDYECPFCSRFYLNTLSQLEEEYIDTGKVKFIYRDFPLESIHANAQKASEATEAARELGGDEKFWEMHNKIFENQQAISDSDLKKYARDIGLDGKKFDNILDTSKYRNEVQKDLQDGVKAGVQGTPTFFINGQKLVGAQPIEAFRDIIEQELNK